MSANAPVQNNTSPMRMSNFTPHQERLAETQGRETTSDYGSRSRSRSGYRKISQSPIQVNTSFEISQKNTENLWNEFKENIRDGSASRQQHSRQPLRNLNSKTMNPNRREEGKFDSHTQEMDKNRTNYITSKHEHRISAQSNFDTHRFIDTSKSEDKNRLLPERHLKKLFKVSGNEDGTHPTALRENISFDRNTQVVAAR